MPSPKCEHGKYRCRDCHPAAFCKHGKEKYKCRDCSNGSSFCEHNRRRSVCRECKGGSRCEHDRIKYYCKICKGSALCEHNKSKSICRECNGACICEHNRVRSYCKECNGTGICPHNKRRNFCVECGGSQTCKGHKETLCYTLGSNKYRGYCVRCFQYFFPDEKVSKNFRTKEKVWGDFIREKFSNYTWTFDKTIEYGCSKYRPDALLNMGTHIILCEHDENQHRDSRYSCDNKRTMAIMQDCGFLPLVIIRFNPDEYINENNQKVTGCWGLDKNGKSKIKRNKKDEFQNRLELFRQNLIYNIENIPEKEVTEIKLFYDIGQL